MASLKCRAKNPDTCIDPNCPEKRGLHSLQGLNTALDKLINTSPSDISFTTNIEQLNNTVKLSQLATDDNFLTRSTVAENVHTPTGVLKTLGKDKSTWVRESVADNFNTPVETLRFLAHDEDETVRVNVARNPNTPEQTLEILSKDPNSDVRIEVAKNQNTSKTVLYTMLSSDIDDTVRFNVWENPKTNDYMKTFAIMVGKNFTYSEDLEK